MDELIGSLAAQAGIDLALKPPELDVSEIQNMARELFEFDRDKIGADHQMGRIVSGTPGFN